MCRSRAWRRHKEKTIVIRRIKRMASYERGWCVSQDINNTSHGYPILSDYIGTPIQFMFKSHVTTSGDSKHKVKYSPNKAKAYWRDGNKKSTREKHKLEFLKILKEHGIK